MRVGVPKEIKTLEYRVGMVPAGVRELVHDGHEVIVETNAGSGIGMTDADYVAAGGVAARREWPCHTGQESWQIMRNKMYWTAEYASSEPKSH